MESIFHYLSLVELFLHGFDDGRPGSIKRERVTAFLGFDGNGFDKTLARPRTKATARSINRAKTIPNPRTHNRQRHSKILTFDSNHIQDGSIVGNPKESVHRLQRMHPPTHDLVSIHGSQAYNQVSPPADNGQAHIRLRSDDRGWSRVPQIRQGAEHGLRVNVHHGPRNVGIAIGPRATVVPSLHSSVSSSGNYIRTGTTEPRSIQNPHTHSPTLHLI